MDPFSLRQRLLKAGKAIHTSISGDVDALLAFHDSWSILSRDLDQASCVNGLDTETESLWDKTAASISLASEHMISLKVATKELTSSYHEELESIFSQFDLHGSEDSATPSSPLSLSRPASPEKGKKPRTTKPTYVRLASTWLLKHLHNPYPSKSTSEKIAVESGSSRQKIDAWFIDARRHIGWTNLRRHHFSNRRSDIINAATRFFVTHDYNQVDSVVGLEFVMLEELAKALYGGKASQGDPSLDMADRDQIQPGKANRSVESDKGSTTCDGSPLCTDGCSNSLGFPAASSSSTDESTFTQQLTPCPSKKRRVAAYEASPPRKRSGCEKSPSPTPTLNILPYHDSATSSSRSTSPESTGPPTPSPRKRRLLEFDNNNPRKRMKSDESRLPLVSQTSMQTEFLDLDNWFQANFFPSALEELQHSPADVEVFDSSKWNSVSQLRPSVTSLDAPDVSYLLSVPPESILVPDELITTTKAYDLDELFQTYDGPALLPSDWDTEDSTAIQTFLPDCASSGCSRDYFSPLNPTSSDPFNWVPNTLLTDLEYGSLHPRKLENTDMAVLHHCSQPTSSLASTYGSTPLLDLDLPSPSVEGSQLYTPTSKADKQRRLAEIQEEARKLKGEIDGCC